MSSYPNHQNNMNKLTLLGLDLSEYSDEDWYDSWDCDSLVDIVSVLADKIAELKANIESLSEKYKAKADDAGYGSSYGSGGSGEGFYHGFARELEKLLKDK